MRELVLNASMGDAVLLRLQDFTPLPGSGYVAGQAVASAVSEIFGDGAAVKYNDVDVFRKQTDDEWQSFVSRFGEEGEGATSGRAIGTTKFTTLEIEEEYSQLVLSSVERYRVIRTLRKGLLNEVVCEFSDTNHQNFLKTFDLNCVQVAVDLESRKLFWTPEFERFTRTRELDVVTLHTPFHSLIRYFKKKAELAGVFGNDKRIIELIAAAYYTEMTRFEEDEETNLREYSNLRWRFGQGYREKLAQVAGLIVPHFSIESEMVKDYEVTHLKPRFDIDKDFCISEDMPNIVHCLPKYSRALRDKHSKGSHRQLSYLTSNITEHSLVRDHWLVHGDAFLNDGVDRDKVAKMEKTVEKHNFARLVCAPTLDEMLAKFQSVQDAVSQRGRWVYQVLARTRGLELRPEVLAAHLDELAILMRKPLTKPGLPKLALEGYSARELVTPMELAVEMPRFGRLPEGLEGNIKHGTQRSIMLTLPKHPRMGYVVDLVRYHGQWDWSVCRPLVRGKHGRECGQREMYLAQTYANYTNLAVILGKYPTAALVWAAPKAANALGWFIGSKVLATLSRMSRSRFRVGYGARLATKLGLESPIRTAAGTWHSQSDVEFWKEHAKRKWMRVFAPKQYAKLAPQYAADAEDIPF